MITLRRYQRHFTLEAEKLRTERLAAQVGQSELARAIGKRRNWLYSREAGYRRLKPAEGTALFAALKRIAESKNAT